MLSKLVIQSFGFQSLISQTNTAFTPSQHLNLWSNLLHANFVSLVITAASHDIWDLSTNHWWMFLFHNWSANVWTIICKLYTIFFNLGTRFELHRIEPQTWFVTFYFAVSCVIGLCHPKCRPGSSRPQFTVRKMLDGMTLWPWISLYRQNAHVDKHTHIWRGPSDGMIRINGTKTICLIL